MKSMKIRVNYSDYKTFSIFEGCEKVKDGYDKETKTIELMIDEPKMYVWMTMNKIPDKIARGAARFGYQSGFDKMEETMKAQPESDDRNNVLKAIEVAKLILV